MSRGALFLACVFVLLAVAAAGSMNPCHGQRGKEGDGVKCERVVIPTNMCNACRMRPFRSNGEFVKCTNIYHIDTPECRTELIAYAQYNKHCDPVRARLVQNFSRRNIQSLDYFIYSICEQCCDCIPAGAREEQYEQRLLSGEDVALTRGNCPAHLGFDVCKALPRVKYFVSPGSDENHDDWPSGCHWKYGIAKQWLKSPFSKDWSSKSSAYVSPELQRLLRNMWDKAGCTAETVWKNCTSLERAQLRV